MPGIRATVAAALLVACLLEAAAGYAQDLGEDFVGLWQGVDNVDGSLRTISITDLDGDGILEVRAHDTFWSLCSGDQGNGYTTGRLDDDGVLRTAGSIQCQSGVEVSLENTYTPQGEADGLIVEHVIGKAFETILFRINY